MNLSWCDKLASTPSVGIRLEKRFTSSGAILNALSPLLNQWVKDDKDTFNLTKQDSFSVDITTDDGYQYGIDPGRIFVDFRHRLKVRQNSGAFPTVEMISKPEPFTALLSESCNRLTEATRLIVPNFDRKFDRLGVVTTTVVEEKDAPPGIQKMIHHFLSPWPKGTPIFHVEVIGVLDQTDKWTDKCLHHVTLTDKREKLITVKFDWHREYAEPRPLADLDKSMRHAEKEALQYFEELAVGNQFNVNSNN